MSTSAADVEVVGDEPSGPDGDPKRGDRKVVSRSPTQIAMERLRKDKLAMVSFGVVLFLFLVGVVGPFVMSAIGIVPDQNYSINPATGDEGLYYGYPYQGPPYFGFDWKHPLGLEPRLGYDNLANLVWGIRTSFSIAILSTLFTTLIGVVIGLMAGFARGFLDTAISFVIDLFMSFPFILGALALAPIITQRFATDDTMLGYAQFGSLAFVLIVFGWMTFARLIRGQVLTLRDREFVEAAQVMGAPTRRILFKELLPNMVAPIVVTVSLTLPGVVAAEAVLSFLGIGITGMPSLGQTILRAQNYYEDYPLYLYAPVLVVALLVLFLNLLGDAVRDAFDPKTRR